MQRRTLLLTGITATAGAMGLVGCAGPNVQDYADQKPTLDLKTYFNGVVDAGGIFTDSIETATMSFSVNSFEFLS